MKIKMLLVILAGLGAFAVWRKVQADRAELDLWNEATAADEANVRRTAAAPSERGGSR